MKLPRLTYNWMSIIGAVIALVALFMILFLLSINLVIGIKNPYLGIVLYMALPAFLVFGLILIPIGIYVHWRIWQKKGELPYVRWPSVDLNNKQQRNAAAVFLFGTFVFIMISAVGMYQAYHYTDSVSFCGLTCHQVMKPEYTTYQQSPHARVKCVECHIGPGVGWYAKSKLSGLYQVYAVMANKYPRPIETPITSLRPARVTCEQCHWPRQFFGAMQRRFDHYMYDKNNSRWPINLLLKVGSGNPMTAQTSGIHWHVNPGVVVEYIARDKRKQDIPWVRVTDKQSGRVVVFQDTETPLGGKEIAAAKPGVMDCMDCHNRSSHNLHSPDYEIDLEIFSGAIDASIPEIKRVAVEAMTREYKTDEAMKNGIATFITDFYLTNYPALYEKKRQIINDAIRATQGAYLKNIFPAMKAKWSDYPNDIGHFIFPGCMRCHDGKHKSTEGLTIPHDCRTCHIILSQGQGSSSETLNLETGLDFRHPVDIGGAWQEDGCFECHTGSQP